MIIESVTLALNEILVSIADYFAWLIETLASALGLFGLG